MIGVFLTLRCNLHAVLTFYEWLLSEKREWVTEAPIHHQSNQEAANATTTVHRLRMTLEANRIG